MVGNMSIHLAKLTAINVTKVEGRALLNIEHDGEHVWLCFEDGDRFAQMNARFSDVAPLVLALSGVTMQGLVDLAGFRQAAERATKATDAMVRVGVNVYGPLTARDEVGSILSKGKLFLQQADFIPDGMVYDNPHVLDLAESPDTPAPDTAIETEIPNEDVPSEDFQAAVSDIYKSLKRGENLEKMEADSSLRTELLPHQQQALTFMVQREIGPVSEEFSLWHEIDPGQEGSGFRNRVTNAIAEVRPPETGGGVLADAMGLGKTLSVLALVAKTRQAAAEWSSGAEEDPNSIYLDPSKKRSKATLVLVSSFLLLNHWLAEIKKHCPDSFNVVRYHGQRRERSPDVVASADIVITTYHTLAAEMAKNGSALHDIAWYRTVLDEAHIIRHRQTTFYEACMKLSSSNRWCLTGTPIQNTLDDLGALFTYLKIRPFDNILTYRCYVTIPFDEHRSRRAAAADRLRTLMDSFCLRRTRHSVEFPQQTENLRRLDLSSAELEQYQQTKAMVDRVVKQRYGEIDHKNAFGLFQAQLQLRLLCNHGTYQNPFAWTTHRNVVSERESIAEIFGHAKELRCACCGQPLPMTQTNSIWSQSTTCNHVCCLECLEQTVGIDDDDFELELSKCPVCASQNISTKLKRRPNQQSASQLSADYFRQHGTSTKISAVLRDVLQGVHTSKR
jgi:SWI/SNF-related matrix-associated actin-dependent regulator of chromatin subfamily A3